MTGATSATRVDTRMVTRVVGRVVGRVVTTVTIPMGAAAPVLRRVVFELYRVDWRQAAAVGRLARRLQWYIFVTTTSIPATTIFHNSVIFTTITHCTV